MYHYIHILNMKEFKGMYVELFLSFIIRKKPMR